MVYIDTRTLDILEKLIQNKTVEVNEHDLQILYPQKLIDISDNNVNVTDIGRELVEIWKENDRPFADPWIDSRIMTLLRLLEENNIKVPESWRSIIEDRFKAVSGGNVREHAHRLCKLLSESSSRLLIFQDTAEKVIELPDYIIPAGKVDEDVAKVLEAQNLVVKSLPKGKYLIFTPLGRLVKKVLERINIGISKIVLSDYILNCIEAVSNGAAKLENYQFLADLGYVDADGYLTPAGRLALKLREFSGRSTSNKIVAVSEPELSVISCVKDLWNRATTNPELAPTRQLVESELKPRWRYKFYSIGLAIEEVLAHGLVREVEYERKLVLELSETCLRLYQHGFHKISADACRALVYAEHFLSPYEEWIDDARETGLIGTYGLTSLGSTVLKVRELVKYEPFLTEIEVGVLKRIPETEAVQKDNVVHSEEEHIALQKLEEKGLVKVLPFNVIILTPAGQLMKSALIGISSGIAAPVTPGLVKLLRALNNKDNADLNRIVRETGLDIEDIKKYMTIARAAKFLGKTGLTELGKQLLAAIDKLVEEGFLKL